MVATEEESNIKRMRRNASVILQDLDAKMEERDRQAGPGFIDASAAETAKPGSLRRRASIEVLGPPRQTGDVPFKTGLVRRKSVEMPDSAASSEMPPVVMATEGEAKPQKLPKHLQVLVAPFAGMCAGALEITSLWPMEWAKVQTQLGKDVGAELRSKGFGIYRGLSSMLVGVPLQGAVRFTTLDSVKAMLVEPGKQAGPATNLVAGLLAGTLEATLVVTPVETVKTRLVDADKSLLRTRFNRSSPFPFLTQSLCHISSRVCSQAACTISSRPKDPPASTAG